VQWASELAQSPIELSTFRFDGKPEFHRVRRLTKNRESLIYYIASSDDAAAAEALSQIDRLGWSEDIVDISVLSVETIMPKDGYILWQTSGGGTQAMASQTEDLRVPYDGALTYLRHRHERGIFPNDARPEIVTYHRSDCLVPYGIMCFKLVNAEGERFSYPSYRSHEIGAMLRHAVGKALAGMVDSAYLKGHCEIHPFYLPLPTISPYGDEDIRRAVMAEPNEGLGVIAGFKNRDILSSLNLWSEKNGKPDKFVCRAVHETNEDDSVFRDYLQPARRWRTVTPMILDRNNGSEDRIRRRIVAMLGFHGYPEPTRVGFRRAFWDMEHLPIKVRAGARLFVHVEVEFPVKVAGPVFAGRGAGYGIGLFARS
jgi:CRISPR-associated protein Csb2